VLCTWFLAALFLCTFLMMSIVTICFFCPAIWTRHVFCRTRIPPDTCITSFFLDLCCITTIHHHRLARIPPIGS